MEYETTALVAGQPIHQVVRVSFVLGRRDWLKLKESDAWHHLEEAASSFQKEQQG